MYSYRRHYILATSQLVLERPLAVETVILPESPSRNRSQCRNGWRRWAYINWTQIWNNCLDIFLQNTLPVSINIRYRYILNHRFSRKTAHINVKTWQFIHCLRYSTEWHIQIWIIRFHSLWKCVAAQQNCYLVSLFHDGLYSKPIRPNALLLYCYYVHWVYHNVATYSFFGAKWYLLFFCCNFAIKLNLKKSYEFWRIDLL